MWPSYTQEVNAKPFIAAVPASFPATMAELEAHLAEPAGGSAARSLLRHT